MKKKGFTLVELLVVIAIIALLMGILMPALARVRQIAYRLYCGTNLSGIGKAMLIYATDYDDELPRAGTNDGSWQSPINNWQAFNAATAYGSPVGNGSISSCFFVLIKYSEVTPKSFLCKGDSGVSAFKVANDAPTRNLVDLWDFGQIGQAHCSYAYHNPFGISGGGGGGYSLTSSSDPGMAVAGDPNPWQNSIETKDRVTTNPSAWNDFQPIGDRESIKAGNALTHQEDGQNVLFIDGHTSFEKESFCGVDDDNIYTAWDNPDPAVANRQKGLLVNTPDVIPVSRNDSLLVTDGGGGKARLCFPADTLVWADGKPVPIIEVRPGQKVRMLDSAADADGKFAPIVEMRPGRKVSVFNNAAEVEYLQEHGVGQYDCYDMTFESGNSIIVVHSHNFLTVAGKWVAVENLTSGSKLQSLKGPITLTSVVKRPMPFVGNAYNLKIKGANVFFVGKDGVAAVDCSKLPKE